MFGSHQDLWISLAGGLVIGFAVTLMLLFLGRVTGISGILGAILSTILRADFAVSKNYDFIWRVTFVAGLVAGGFVLAIIYPESLAVQPDRPALVLVIAGFLVGFGTLMGSGCTSGHAVCGLSRLSIRSVVSTLIFMLMGMLTVYVMRNGLR